MRVTTVSYRETRTFGNYQNVCVEMTTEVPPGMTSGDVCDELKGYVQVQLAKRVGEREREIAAQDQEWDKSRELRRIEDDIASATARYEKMKAFLAKFGVTDLEEIPF